jgi:hypothetical protein
MSAPGAFERARQLARAAVDGAGAGEQVAVLTFADAVEVAVRPTTDRALARAALDRAAPGAGATRYRRALSAAAELADGAAGTIVVVTDLQASGWDEGDRVSLPASLNVEVADVGAPPPNLAVTALQLEADRLVASVHNSGAAQRETTLRLSMHDPASPAATSRVAGTSAASIAAGQTVRVALARGPGALASVSLEDASGAQADNTRFLVLDDASRPVVLVVTTTGDLARDGFYLQQALSAGGDAARYAVEAAGTSPGAFPDATRLQSVVAVVLTSTRGLDRPGRARLAKYLSDGGGLFVAAGPDVDGAVLGDLLGAGTATLDAAASSTSGPAGARTGGAIRTLAPDDLRHPVFRVFDGNAAALGLPRFDRVATLGGSCPPLARFTSGEDALVECRAGGGRALVFASDLDGRWNNFPRHAAFLPFVQEAVAYLAGPKPPATEYTVGDVPDGVPPRPGFAALVTAPRGGQGWAAVNVSPGEADATRISEAEFGAAITRVPDEVQAEGRFDARQREERQHIWQYLLVAMLAIMAGESLVGRKAT